MDDGTLGFVLSSFGFMDETDVGINRCCALLYSTTYFISAWIKTLGLISYRPDGATLHRLHLWLLELASENFSLLGETSLLNGFVWSVAAPSSLFSFRDFSFLVLKNQIRRDSIHYFSAMSWLRMSILVFCHFFGFKVEAVVGFDESFARLAARVWPFGTRCWGLPARLV
jgi:hypothetical protein